MNYHDRKMIAMSSIWNGSSTNWFDVFFKLNVVFCFLSPCIVVSQEIICERVNTSRCRFRCNSGEDIDISALDSDSNLPRFTSIQDISNTGVTYMWNPCKRFNYTSSCLSVNVCQRDANNNADNYGDEGPTVAFDTLRKQYYLSYLGPEKLTLGERKTNVYMKYDSSAGRTSDMSRIGNYLSMTLYTKYAPLSKNGSGSTDDKSGGLSTGTVLLIIFFSVLFLYLIIGSAFMKFQKGAHGKEIIPHFAFWSKIPGLAKDGCVYSVGMVQKCGSSYTRERGYENI